jgi:Fe-S cluster biosynthesis and repair protein YggX
MNNEITIDIVDQLCAMWSNKQTDLIDELLLNLSITDPVAKWYFNQKLGTYEYGSKISKDVKKWFKINYIKEYSGYNASELICMLHKENKLSKENFRFLEKEARKRVFLVNAEIYYANIKLKEEYKKYL